MTHEEATSRNVMRNELKPNRSGNYHHNGNPKHGLYRDNAALFNVWQTMKSRCENPNRTKYKDYGGRGIKVCDEWHEASNFVEWALKNGYKKGLQLDRIDNDGDYCPQNCRFVTPKQNSRNRRNTKRLTINGVTKQLSSGARKSTLVSLLYIGGLKRKDRNMQNTESLSLRKCSFCGGEALLIALRDEYRRLNPSMVHCSVCDAETKFYPLKKEAIEAWNRRVNDES